MHGGDVLSHARADRDKPEGWFWYMAEIDIPRWGYLGSLDLRSKGHDFREWFIGIGRFVITIGRCGELVP